MDVTHEADSEQMRLWNGVRGRAWVEVQAVVDQMFKPLEDMLLDALTARPADRVLDVGCGTGATTLAAAQAIGGQGRCIGIDISEPMIAAARSRAGREGSTARFICADAQTHGFEPAGFDAIVSRIGVMFFDSPVRAFANLRHAAVEDAALHFVAWRSAEENPFMTTAERAAAPHLPQLPAGRPDGPGQFAFAQKARVRHVLQESGWTGIDIQPVDVLCTLPEKELVRYFTRLGPLGQIIDEADDRTRSRIIETVRAAFDPYVGGEEVRFTAACWMVGARASSMSATPEGAGDA